MKTLDWLSGRACRGANPDIFFPVPPGTRYPVDPHRYEEALAICAGCPVAEDCLEHFIDERHGVFGGTTPGERQRLRRRAG